MSKCNLCRYDTVEKLLDLGMQPICNRFLSNQRDEEQRFPMRIGQCNTCGIVQIIDPIPVAELVPPYDWITYNEPEEHLDQLSEIISNLSGLKKDSKICGISFKDDSTLVRLQRRGFNNTWRIDPADDLDINGPGIGVETIQDRLTPERSNLIVQKHGTSDAVIARHILEHTHKMYRFMNAIINLVNPEGYIIIEVPDCLRALEKKDYTTLWEEHIVYFSPTTFRQIFTISGLSLIRFECYPYPFENSLVGIARLQEKITPSLLSPLILEDEISRAKAFSQGFPKHRIKLKKFLSEYKQINGKIAMFGAGHLACTFINLLDLKDVVEFVVDDNPKKLGLFMPGSGLPIRSSASLINDNIKLCLLSVSPQAENKVIKNNQGFIVNGGIFASIFSDSNYALLI